MENIEESVLGEEEEREEWRVRTDSKMIRSSVEEEDAKRREECPAI